MAIPDYQNFLLPLLQLLEDGREYSVREIYDTLANQLAFSEADRQQMLPSGQQQTYANRMGWATTHLTKAALITRPKRGHVIITDRGRELLAQRPEKITAKSLEVFRSTRSFVRVPLNWIRSLRCRSN